MNTDTYILTTYTKTVKFTGKWDYQRCSSYHGATEGGRENTIFNAIMHMLLEFSDRDEATKKYMRITLGDEIEVTHPPHFSHGENIRMGSPHFNVAANDKTYHVYHTKNHDRIVRITEVIATKFDYDPAAQN